MSEVMYLAGPMRGYQDFNYPYFFSVAAALRALGHDVNNPAENCGLSVKSAVAYAKGMEKQGKTFGDYFRPDMRMIADSEAMCLLPGWQASQGAALEYRIGREMGLPMYRYTGQLSPLHTVIGVSGYARTGKDTIARALVEHRDYVRLSFADVVRDTLYALNPHMRTYSDHEYEPLQVVIDGYGWDKAKKIFPEIRTLQQKMGGDAGRKVIGVNVWVDAVLAKMQDGGKYVISDLRYPNEYAAVKLLGGQCWRVERDGIGPVNDHESEIALDDHTFDLTFSNNSSVAAVGDQATQLVAA